MTATSRLPIAVTSHRSPKLHTAATSDLFSAEPGPTCAFYSQAIDSVGHLETNPTIPGTQTTVTTATGPLLSLHLFLPHSWFHQQDAFLKY